MVEAKSWAPGSHLGPSWANLSPADTQLEIEQRKEPWLLFPWTCSQETKGCCSQATVSTPSILPRAFPWQRESPWKGVGGGGFS